MHMDIRNSRSLILSSRCMATMTSAAPATWANWGLYSTPVTTGSNGDDRGQRVAQLAQQPLDQAAETPVSISVSGRSRLVGAGRGRRACGRRRSSRR